MSGQLLTAQPQLADWVTTVRLSLHVAAAAVWVGGQFVLAGLVPTIRGFGDDAPRAVARAFGRLSWPAFWLLVVTGFWNYAAMDASSATGSWNSVFVIKMACVVVSGVGAYLHTKATNARARGMFAGIGALGSIAALVLGVALAG